MSGTSASWAAATRPPPPTKAATAPALHPTPSYSVARQEAREYGLQGADVGAFADRVSGLQPISRRMASPHYRVTFAAGSGDGQRDSHVSVATGVQWAPATGTPGATLHGSAGSGVTRSPVGTAGASTPPLHTPAATTRPSPGLSPVLRAMDTGVTVRSLPFTFGGSFAGE